MINRKIYFVIVFYILIFTITPFALSRFSPQFYGGGLRLSLVAPFYDFDAGVGLGTDLYIKFIEDFLYFVPSFEYSYASRNRYHYYYYPPENYWLNKHWLNEFALNADVHFYPPLYLPVIKPYAGGGLGLVISREDWQYQNNAPPYNIWYDNYTSFGPCFDFVFGIDALIGNYIGTVELKIKVGTSYNLFKFTLGLNFPFTRSYYRRY